jgi:hypothetical protein
MARLAERMPLVGAGERSGTSWTSAFPNTIWEREKTPGSILGVDDLRGFALWVLSGSKTRERIYLETI